MSTATARVTLCRKSDGKNCTIEIGCASVDTVETVREHVERHFPEGEITNIQIIPDEQQ